MSRWWGTVVVVIAVSLTPVYAVAQDAGIDADATVDMDGGVDASTGAEPDTAERQAMARGLFEEGVVLAQQDRYVQAADRFRRAYALRPAPAIAFNWAAALAERGQLLHASELLRQVIGHAEAERGLRELAEERLAQTESLLGLLTVELAGPTEQVRITVDGRELPPEVLAAAVPANPGNRYVEAWREQEVVADEQVEVPEGGEARVVLRVPEPEPEPESPSVPEPDTEVETEPPPFAPQPAPAQDTEGGGVSRWWLWVGAGAAVVAAVATAVALTVGGGEPAPVAGNGDPAVLRWP